MTNERSENQLAITCGPIQSSQSSTSKKLPNKSTNQCNCENNKLVNHDGKSCFSAGVDDSDDDDHEDEDEDDDDDDDSLLDLNDTRVNNVRLHD